MTNEKRYNITDEQIENNVAWWGASDEELAAITRYDLVTGSLGHDESLLGEESTDGTGRTFDEIVTAYLETAHSFAAEAEEDEE